MKNILARMANFYDKNPSSILYSLFFGLLFLFLFFTGKINSIFQPAVFYVFLLISVEINEIKKKLNEG